ncbi:hypothetical protein LIER_06427 [Lithospermum erythrorhizon]|uniref:Uncharacterized protein n=1 Tax=Lithospermum erythrorhizon TaxID=34254 RepID=A0AAV3P5W0_LITER
MPVGVLPPDKGSGGGFTTRQRLRWVCQKLMGGVLGGKSAPYVGKGLFFFQMETEEAKQGALERGLMELFSVSSDSEVVDGGNGFE